MSVDADTIRDAEIEELQRRVEKLERKIREREAGPGCPVYPRPYPDSPSYPWHPWTRPYRIYW